MDAKSGYRLSLENELRSLRALVVTHEVEVVLIRLAAHMVPAEHAESGDDYVRLVAGKIYPAVVAERLAESCDVSCECGVLTFAAAERALRGGKAKGVRLRIHADQLSRTGACRVGAMTADQLKFVTKEDAVAMREAGVSAVTLPAANYFLDQPERRPERAMILMQCPVAIATDFNPGSAPTQSVPFAINAACVRFGTTVAEAIVGATSTPPAPSTASRRWAPWRRASRPTSSSAPSPTTSNAATGSARGPCPRS